MGCGASHSRVESSDGTDAGGFVHLRNLGEGVSLADALAPKAQFVDELHEPTFCTTKALEDSSLQGKHSSVLELSRTANVSTISTPT